MPSLPFPSLRLRIRPLAAVVLSMAAASSHAVPVAIDLPAQPLATSIQQLSRQSGLSIGGDAALLEGKAAPAIRGKLEPADALRKLLEGSGLSVSFEGNKAVIGKSAPVLKEVVVVGDAPKEGSAAAGYRPETVSRVGPWGTRPIQETPYSISVLSSELIENVSALSPEEIFKYSPYAHVYMPANRLTDNIYLRGFYNNLQTYDGMRIYGVSQTMEDKERIEIMTGFSGFMYGFSNPAGVVNYVLKRAPAAPLATISLTNVDGGANHLHADLGGLLGDGSMGWRLNLVTQDGETFVDDQKVRKWLVSGAFDWRVTDSMKLEFDAASYYKKNQGMTITYGTASANLDPKRIDSSKLWGQKWGLQSNEYDYVGGRLTWDISDLFTLRTATRYTEASGERLNINSQGLTSFDSTYQQTYYHISPTDYAHLSGYAYLDSRFDTGPIKHTLTAGASYERSKAKAAPTRTASGIIGEFDFSRPVFVPKPNYAIATGPKVDFNQTRWTTLTVGDDIRFSDSWSALLGVSRSSLDLTNYNTDTGAVTARYDKARNTPTVSLMYKPAPALTTYISYVEALEQGGTAPAVANGRPVANAGEVLAPMVSKQKEIGVKATRGDVLLTAALFHIDKANQYTDPNTDRYVQDGRQVHKGLELTATGKLTRNLTVLGGYVLMDTEIKKNATNPAFEGNRPSGIAEKLGKIHLEYMVPGVPGLALSAGAFYTGDFYGDLANTAKYDSVTTYNLGARYQTKVSGKDVALRLNVSNATNKRYWTVFNYLGDPRYVTLAAQVWF